MEGLSYEIDMKVIRVRHNRTIAAKSLRPQEFKQVLLYQLVESSNEHETFKSARS